MVQLKGIDVSDHNQEVDWDTVKASGVQFAMLRLGFGGNDPSQDDKQFERNVSECERVGIPWGAYLYSYALTVEQAKSERDHALRLLKGKNPKYPVAFDMEDADGYKAKHGMPCNDTLVQICDTFLNDVEAAGYYVVLYASECWLENELNSPQLDRYNKWVAQWGVSATTYSKKYCLWQFTDSLMIGGKQFDGNYSLTDFSGSQPSQPETVPAFHEAPAKATASAAVNTDGYMHVVQSGENLTVIAAKYGLTVDYLQKLNNLPNKDFIYAGERLKLKGSVPLQPQYYVVKAGDNLTNIAKANGTTIAQLKALNGIQDENKIQAGQKIRVK